MALIQRRKKPNPKFERFLVLCARGMTAEEAGEIVGYAVSTAQHYKAVHKKRIKELALARFDEMVPTALRAIDELMTTGKGTVRLHAANRALEGAGAGVIHKSEVTHRTDQEIDAELLSAFQGDQAKLDAFLEVFRAQGTLH